MPIGCLETYNALWRHYLAMLVLYTRALRARRDYKPRGSTLREEWMSHSVTSLLTYPPPHLKNGGWTQASPPFLHFLTKATWQPSSKLIKPKQLSFQSILPDWAVNNFLGCWDVREVRTHYTSAVLTEVRDQKCSQTVPSLKDQHRDMIRPCPIIKSFPCSIFQTPWALELQNDLLGMISYNVQMIMV